NIITNADHGALYSWQVYTECLGQSGFPWVVYNDDPNCVWNVPENHLTAMSDGAISSDAIWQEGTFDNPVVPVLQLENDDFAGVGRTWAGNAVLVFSAWGVVKWTLAGYYPMLATAGGGLVADSGSSHSMFDAGGNATGNVFVPTFQSWNSKVYEIGSVQRIERFPVLPAATFWPQYAGSPSQNGAQSNKFKFTETQAGDPARIALIADRLSQVKQKLEADTNGTCAAWLTNPVRPELTWSSVLSVMIANQMYAHGIYEIETANGRRRVDDQTAASINGTNPDKSDFGLPVGK